MEQVIKLNNVWKIYRTGKVEYPALRGLSMEVKKGEFLAIMGPSGSGKSTLLNLIGALDKPTKGEVYINGKNINMLNDAELAIFRRHTIGFVFQTFNLIPRLTAVENVEVPMIASGIPHKERREKALKLLEEMGLKEWADHKPTELSGGQQQRVAIARAFANNPHILLADEPTGNLDTANKELVMKVLRQLNQRKNVTIIVVTHDPEVANKADRIIYLRDGKISKIEVKNNEVLDQE